MSFLLEHKAGNSYIHGTDYDGYAFGLSAQSILGNHKLKLNFIGAPQQHNQAQTFQDIDLLKTLGREYNRKNHDWQENYYFKPLLCLAHEWAVSPDQKLNNNLFVSIGVGADQTIIDDVFDVETGAVDFQKVSTENDMSSFGAHGSYLWDNFGIRMTHFSPAIIDDRAYFFNYAVSAVGRNIFTDQHEHTWQERRRRNHFQIGFSSLWEQKIGDKFDFVGGGEGRFWRGHRTSEAWKMVITTWMHEEQTFIEELQPIYDYNTQVFNLSTFGRFTYKPYSFLTFQGGVTFAYNGMEVIENPIHFYDFGSGQLMSIALRTTADQIDVYKNLKFMPEDYRRNYPHCTPWMGSNLNLNRYLNIFLKYANAKKEPSILDWYDFDKGPFGQTFDSQNLKPESIDNYEVGFGFQNNLLNTNISYYHIIYHDKIETVVDINNRQTTMNVGRALFQGVEIEGKAKFGNLELAGSGCYAKNRWKKLNVLQIFGADARYVTGKVVPFSPERTFTGSIGYTRKKYHFKLMANWWDIYYGTFTNQYTTPDFVGKEAWLPCFFDLSAQIIYKTHSQNFHFTFRLDLNNITNRTDNFMRAQYSIDYTRNDELAGKHHWYILQAPLFNAFFTTEISIK